MWRTQDSKRTAEAKQEEIEKLLEEIIATKAMLKHM